MLDKIYTPWSNLKKTVDMEAGAVSYHNMKLVKKVKVDKDREIIKRVEKTREWKDVDLKGEFCTFCVLRIKLNRHR